MHELSLGQAIADHVDRRAAGRRVRCVEVRIGYLRQVVPDSLRFAWEMITAGTDLEGASLVVEHVPAVVHCNTCDAETTLEWPVLACAACESMSVDLRSGDEMELAWFDVVEEVG